MVTSTLWVLQLLGLNQRALTSVGANGNLGQSSAQEHCVHTETHGWPPLVSQVHSLSLEWNSHVVQTVWALQSLAECSNHHVAIMRNSKHSTNEHKSTLSLLSPSNADQAHLPTKGRSSPYKLVLKSKPIENEARGDKSIPPIKPTLIKPA